MYYTMKNTCLQQWLQKCKWLNYLNIVGKYSITLCKWVICAVRGAEMCVIHSTQH